MLHMENLQTFRDMDSLKNNSMLKSPDTRTFFLKYKTLPEVMYGQIVQHLWFDYDLLIKIS